MILTVDALVGGTLSLALVAGTAPVTMNMAKKAANDRRDLIAERVTTACNLAMFRDEDLKGVDLEESLVGNVTARGRCGAPHQSIILEWKSGAKRVIRYSNQVEMFVSEARGKGKKSPAVSPLF